MRRAIKNPTRTKTFDGIEQAAAQFKSRPAREVLSEVRAFPTIFPWFDLATFVDGHPLERVALVHGPSGQGKTSFVLGLIASCLRLQGPAHLADAERTTPITWLRQFMGGLADSPIFFASRPDTYEDCRKEIRDFLVTMMRLKESGKMSFATPGLVVIASLKKLGPKGLWDKIMQAQAEGESRGPKKGATLGDLEKRMGQLKAQMNSMWLDEQVPLLEKAGASSILIAREMENPDAQPWEKKAGRAYKIGGGGNAYFDASMVMRCERARYVEARKRTAEDEDSKEKIPCYGEQIRITIRKTKVSGHEDKQTVAYFHTSNGVLEGVSAGFDKPRDLVVLGQKLGGITQAGKVKDGAKGKGGGGWITWRNHRWQGEHQAVRALHAAPDVVRELESDVRAVKELVTKAVEEKDA